MLQFGRLLSFPLTFKNLNEKIKAVSLNDINATIVDNNILIESKANNHHVLIVHGGNKLSVAAPVVLYCDCEFFKFNLAYGLHKNNSLLNPEQFVLKPPKKKNTSLTLSGCKHIILVAQTVWANRNLIK